MLDWIVKGIRSIVPPGKDADPTNWRIGVFVMLSLTTLTLILHLVAAKGLLMPVFGISAVASAADIQAVKETQTSVLYAIYAPQIRSLVRERCSIDSDDHDEAEKKERINQNLDRVLKDYRKATGEDFKPMPTCQEV